jgi:hypothetical protein
MVRYSSDRRFQIRREVHDGHRTSLTLPFNMDGRRAGARVSLNHPYPGKTGDGGFIPRFGRGPVQPGRDDK